MKNVRIILVLIILLLSLSGMVENPHLQVKKDWRSGRSP